MAPVRSAATDARPSKALASKDGHRGLPSEFLLLPIARSSLTDEGRRFPPRTLTPCEKLDTVSCISVICKGEPLRRNAAATYDDLLRSARLEFAEKGFADASIRSISQRAGVTIGALYQHFESKEDVFSHVVGPVPDGFLSLSEEKKRLFVKALETAGPRGAIESIPDVSTSFLSYAFDNWEAFSILVSNPETETYRAFFDKMVANEVSMTRLLASRMDDERYRALSAEHIEAVISAQYASIFTLMRSRKAPARIRQDLDVLLRFFLHGWNGLLNDGAKA